MTADRPATDALTPRNRLGLAAWAALVVGLFLAAGLPFVHTLRANRQAAADRHAARIDPAADEPGVTAADRDLPPGATPTRVTAGVYVDRILQLSVKDVSWTVEFYLWFRWRGELPKSCEDFQVVDGSIDSKDKQADETIAGERYQRFRVVAKVTKFFDVSRFPLDDHLLTIAVELPGHVRQELLFVADRENTAVSSRVRVPAYEWRPATVLEKPHSYKTTRGDPRLPDGHMSTYSQLRAGIPIARSGWGMYFKLFQSLFVAVVLAHLSFFIRPTDVDPRFGLGVGALFAAVANAYVISSLVPDTGGLALADVLNAVGIGVILLTVVQSTASLYLYDRRGQQALSRAFDRVSFAVMLPSYALLNVALTWAAAPSG